MVYQRGDIIHVYFDLPKSKETKTHPALVISNYDVYDQDEMYICVMLTSDEEIDGFSFEITNDMLNKPLPKKSQARVHLVTYIVEKHFCGNKPISRMKSLSVDRLVERINEISLSEDY